MPRYTFECELCQGAFEIQRPMAESPGETHPCPQCGKTAARVWDNKMPFLFGGERSEDYMLSPQKGIIMNEGARRAGITARKQRELYSQQIQLKRKQAREVQMARRGSRRKCGEMRLVGSVPTELFRNAQLTSGDVNYWNRDRKKTLKKHGLLFDE